MREEESRSLLGRVLLVVGDRRFRALISALLSQRGYTVLVCRRGEDVAEVVTRDAVDVVLLDASPSLTAAARQTARLKSLHPRVAIVAVGEALQSGLAAMPVLPKWTDFEALVAAIERARECPGENGVIAGVR